MRAPSGIARRVVAGFSLALAVAPRGAQGSSESGLRVAVECEGPSEAWCASMSRDLRASLATRNVELAEDVDGEGLDARARVEFSARTSPLRVRIVDRLTSKELVRDVDLRDLPEDGSALAAAIAVDELLSASWAELSLVRDPPPTREESRESPPPEPKSSVPSAARVAAEARLWELALGVGAEAGEGLGPTYGFDGAFARRLGDFRASVGGGVRRSAGHSISPEEGSAGTLAGELVFGRVTLDHDWLALPSWRAGPVGALQFGHGRVTAAAASGYRGASLEGFVGSARLGLFLQGTLDALFLRTELGGAVALGVLRPTFDGTPLPALGGPEVWATFAGGVCF